MKKKILLDTWYLIFRSVITRIIAIPIQIITARVLGPADFGLLKTITYIPSLVKYGTIGFSSVALRDVLHLRGEMKHRNLSDKEDLIKGVAFSSDLVWAFGLALIILVVSFWYQHIVSWGMRIAALTLIIAQVRMIYLTIAKIEKNFSLIARMDVVYSVVMSVCVVMSIWYFKTYGVLLSAIIAEIVVVVMCARVLPIVLARSFNWDEIVRQLAISVPLSLGTMTVGLQGWTERLLVCPLVGMNAFGTFMFGMVLIQTSVVFINNAMQAFSAHLYERLGSGDEDNNERLVVIPTYTFAVVSAYILLVIVMCAHFVILRFLPAYASLIGRLPLIGVIIYVTSISAVYMTAMTSKRANQQVRLLVFRLISVGLFALIVISSRNLGVTGAYLGTLGARVFLGAASFVSMYGIFHKKTIPFKMVFQYVGPFIWTIPYSMITKNMRIDSLWNCLLGLIIFSLWYMPVILIWEKEVGVLRFLWQNRHQLVKRTIKEEENGQCKVE